MATDTESDSLAPSSDDAVFDMAVLEDDKEGRRVPAGEMSSGHITFPDGGFRAWLVVFGVRHSTESIDSC